LLQLNMASFRASKLSRPGRRDIASGFDWRPADGARSTAGCS